MKKMQIFRKQTGKQSLLSDFQDTRNAATGDPWEDGGSVRNGFRKEALRQGV
jgi:hypothetical protein